jgi:hypothetical protein
MPRYRNGTGSSTAPAQITGLEVALQRRSRLQRAELGASIKRGDTRLGSLTVVQISRIVGVSSQYIHRQLRGNSAPPNSVPVQLAAE